MLMSVTRRRPKDRMRGSADRLTGCPLTKNRSNWCFALCHPQGGLGHCGRAAPHAIVGRTQQAILERRISA
jgi:hypothetical protein